MNLRTLGQVSRELNTKYYTILYLEQTGKIPPIPRIAGRRVFDDELIAIIQNRIKPTRGNNKNEYT